VSLLIQEQQESRERGPGKINEISNSKYGKIMYYTGRHVDSQWVSCS